MYPLPHVDFEGPPDRDQDTPGRTLGDLNPTQVTWTRV